MARNGCPGKDAKQLFGVPEGIDILNALLIAMWRGQAIDTRAVSPDIILLNITGGVARIKRITAIYAAADVTVSQ
jgi:hypothetical protein